MRVLAEKQQHCNNYKLNLSSALYMLIAEDSQKSTVSHHSENALLFFILSTFNMVFSSGIDKYPP